MRRKVQLLFMVVSLIAINYSGFGVIAFPYPVEITQSDGTKISIILKGDEHSKSTQTVDGYSLLRNKRGIFEYATLNSRKELVLSGIKASDLPDRKTPEQQFLSKTKKGLASSQSQTSLLKSASNLNQASSQAAFPTSGSRKLICILIGFTDKPFTKTKADFESLFNLTGYNTDGATGSVSDFYKENSWGQLDLTVTVAGPYTAAHDMAYYGANNTNGDDINPRELISEAVNLADPVVNYADFDNDNNGNVDGVYVIYAGYGEEYTGVSSDAIWAHAWNISSVNLDGRWISSYSCSSELRGNSGSGICRIGVICHEFGHVLGASDYYDTNYETNGKYEGTGNWDLMAGGSWNNYGITPAHHNPYTKIYDYGWASATTLSSVATITLNNAEQNSNSFYRINTATSGEFFLIENRQKHLFDSNIPGHGMIIYHVDDNYISTAGNAINAGSHQGMYPVCADASGNPPAVYGLINSAGLPYPGASIMTSFTDITIPDSKSWSGANTNKPITNIAENTSNKTVSFSFMAEIINSAPIAHAGPNQSVDEGTIVTLDGSASSDPDSNPLTYNWTAPPGITLNSSTSLNPTFTAPEVSASTDYIFSLVVNDGTVNSEIDQIVVTVKSVIRISLKVILEGSYNKITYLMNTSLNPNPINSILPLSQPYGVIPWNYSGIEVVNSVPPDVVDWILVELRQATSPELATSATILATRAAFLKNDGSIVDLDGSSPVQFENSSLDIGNELFAVIRHRNHLSIMSAAGSAIFGGIYSYDFTTGLVQAFGGGNGYKLLNSGASTVGAMVAADIDQDGSIFVSDYNRWAIQFGTTNGYNYSDLDMDRNIFVSDYNLWAINFGSNADNLLKSSTLRSGYFSCVPK